MSHLLITGFTPFDGRSQNASWIAAKSLCLAHGTDHIAHCLRIPVRWAEPQKQITLAVQRWQPRIIISMGEGKPGQFTLESLARNTSKERQDNDGRLPHGAPIDPQGEAERHSSAPLASIANTLKTNGVRVTCSTDAGAFLCEELLYCLEGVRASNSSVELVLFAHLPPFGTPLEYRGAPRHCDPALLLDFSQNLLAAGLQHLPKAIAQS